VLEWAGNSGNEVLHKRKFDAALGLLKQVVLALHALQEASPPIIHHDLKWDNVAVDEQNCLKLIDLDLSMKGIWKDRNKATLAVRAYAPPESQPFFCGLSPPQEDEAACPAAYSYDMFAAGIMSLSVCSLDMLFFVKSYYAANATARAGLISRVVQAAEQGLDAREKLGGIGITHLRGLYGNRFKMHLLNFNDGDKEKIHEIAKLLNINVFLDILRLQACQQLGPDKLDILESMTASSPGKRPKANEVLQSSLFEYVKTGCSTDPNPTALLKLMGRAVRLQLLSSVTIAIGTAYLSLTW